MVNRFKIRRVLVVALVTLILGCTSNDKTYAASTTIQDSMTTSTLESGLSVCDNLSDSFDRGGCYLKIAINLSDAGICPLIKDDELNEKICYTYFMELGNYSVCPAFGDAWATDNCFRQVAVLTSNESLCDVASNESIRQNCRYEVGVIGNSTMVCASLSSPSDKDYCLEAAAINSKNISICGGIEGDPIRRYCEYVLGNEYDLVAGDTNDVDILYFFSYSCPHCSGESILLENLERIFPRLNVTYLEIPGNDRTNLNLYGNLSKKFNKTASGVPGTFIGNDMFLGYDDPHHIGRVIREKVFYCLYSKDPCAK